MKRWGISLLAASCALLFMVACGDSDSNIRITQTVSSNYANINANAPLTVPHNISLSDFTDWRTKKSSLKCSRLSLASSFIRLTTIRYSGDDKDVKITFTGYISATATGDKFPLFKWVFEGPIDLSVGRMVRLNRTTTSALPPKMVIKQDMVGANGEDALNKLREILDDTGSFTFHAEVVTDKPLTELSLEFTMKVYATTDSNECDGEPSKRI